MKSRCFGQLNSQKVQQQEVIGIPYRWQGLVGSKEQETIINL